jgi:hypothetical protein
MGLILSWLLGPIGRWVSSALAVIALVGAVYGYGHHQGAQAERAAEARAYAKLAKKQDAISVKADEHHAAASAAIETRYQTLIEKVRTYVPLQTSPECIVPQSAIGLLNAGLQDAPAPRLVDAAPSPFGTADLIANGLANAEVKRLNDQQLIDLQDWVKAQQRVSP